MPSYTDPVFQRNASLCQLETRIASCQRIGQLADNHKQLAKGLTDSDHAVTTERSIFYAQGGGQPSDIGVISLQNEDGNEFIVSLVRKTDDGTIFHFGTFRSPSAANIFADGKLVNQVINKEKRRLHSQLHTGGHIIGLAMKLLVPVLGQMTKVKANHMPGEASMEFQGLLYNHHKAIIEEKIAELVHQSLEIKIHWWTEQQMRAESLKPKHAPGPDGLYRVMEIEGLDFNACGGTHVPRTGDAGDITIRKISRQKGISRLSYEVSGMALPDFWTTDESEPLRKP